MATVSNTHYDLLGVKADATAAEIKSAYRGLAKQFHTDVAGAGTEGIFRAIQTAYSTLSDPGTRETYDRGLRGDSAPTSPRPDSSTNNYPPRSGGSTAGSSPPPPRSPNFLTRREVGRVVRQKVREVAYDDGSTAQFGAWYEGQLDVTKDGPATNRLLREGGSRAFTVEPLPPEFRSVDRVLMGILWQSLPSVSADFTRKGVRKVLKPYGHTLAHARQTAAFERRERVMAWGDVEGTRRWVADGSPQAKVAEDNAISKARGGPWWAALAVLAVVLVGAVARYAAVPEKVLRISPGDRLFFGIERWAGPPAVADISFYVLLSYVVVAALTYLGYVIRANRLPLGWVETVVVAIPITIAVACADLLTELPGLWSMAAALVAGGAYVLWLRLLTALAPATQLRDWQEFSYWWRYRRDITPRLAPAWSQVWPHYRHFKYLVVRKALYDRRVARSKKAAENPREKTTAGAPRSKVRFRRVSRESSTNTSAD